MTINLEDYIGKTVEVELGGGVIRRGKLKKSGEHRAFPYSISLSYYNQYGRYRLLDEYSTGGDIIKIKELKETPTEPETMSNVIRSKIDIFTIGDERVEVTLDDDGLFLTACGKGAREDLSIGSKDLVIAVAKAILEHYQENLK